MSTTEPAVYPLIAWIVMAALVIVAAAIIICMIAKPMRALLGANSYMAPAKSFYVRAFGLTVFLGALASIVGRQPLAAAEGQGHRAAMEYVWWVAGGLGSAFWSIALFLAGYVLLLTVLFAVLGRYRDQ